MVESAITTAKGISDYGFLVVTAAFFLVLAASLCVACFKWFKQTINDVIDKNNTMVSELLKETRTQNEMLQDISDSLRPESENRVQTLAKLAFELSLERVLLFITTVRTENHIVDREATVRKIHENVTNLHNKRNIKFSAFAYKGKKLSSYTSNEWIEWVSNAIETEVYNGEANPSRERTNIGIIYDKIENDFNNRLKS